MDEAIKALESELTWRTHQRDELLAALNGLIGLVQLVDSRDDMPAVLADNHRYHDALALVTRIESEAQMADHNPTEAEVNAAIDELADKAASKVSGTSGHAWGQRMNIKRQADMLKNVLADCHHCDEPMPNGRCWWCGRPNKAPQDQRDDRSVTRQLLREIAERIRLRCGDIHPCAECRQDAEDLERIAREST
jgi:hypothetical protein